MSEPWTRCRTLSIYVPSRPGQQNTPGIHKTAVKAKLESAITITFGLTCIYHDRLHVIHCYSSFPERHKPNFHTLGDSLPEFVPRESIFLAGDKACALSCVCVCVFFWWGREGKDNTFHTSRHSQRRMHKLSDSSVCQ